MSEDISAQLAGFREGSLLAGYRLERQVGAGGMAVVFRARDERLGRPVALKILSPGLASDSAFRTRFIAESRAAAKVDDPHIIPVYEAGEADGVLFIAMRFVAGGDLRQVLEREGALAPDRAAEFISPVASALDAAHSAGLVHRDVKPGNILVDAAPGRPDHVYLSDFGIVKGAVSVNVTAVGGYIGTPDYMAPEQISGRGVDGRTDEYSLACVAFQLLTGALPFERDQLPAVIYAQLSAPPPSLVSRRPDLPAAVDLVVAKAMAKTAEKRYESCGDFADALREALGLASYHRGSSAGAPPVPPPSAASVDALEGVTVDSLPDSEPSGTAGTPDGPRPGVPPPAPAAAPVTGEPGRLDIVPAPSQVDEDGGTASPAAEVSEGLPAAAAAAVMESQRTGDPGTAVPSDEAGPLPGAAGTDVLAAGLPDLGSATAPADPQSSATVAAEVIPPPQSPPAGAAPPTAPDVAGEDQRPPRRRGPVIAWIRRHRLPVLALACATLAAAVTIPFLSPSSPNSSHPAASSSPSTSSRPAAAGTGWVSLGNLSENPSPVDVYLYRSGGSSPQSVQHGVAYGTILPYQPVDPGDYSVKVRAAGSSASSNPVWSVSLTVQAGGAYTVAPLRASAQQGQLKVIDDNLTTPKGKSFVRVIQADINQGQVTFHCSCAAGAPGNITTDAAPGNVSPQVPIPAGTWTMTATGSSAKASLPVSLTAGTVHTEIVIAKPGGGIQIINLVNAVPSYRRVSVDLPSKWHNVPITSVAFSPSGATLAIASGQICLWDIAATNCTSSFGSASAYSLAYSPGGQTLAVGDSGGRTYLWNPVTGRPIATLPDPGSGGVFSVAFGRDRQSLAAGDANGRAYVWNPVTGKLIVTLPGPGSKGVNSVAFSPDGQSLAAGDANGRTYVWNPVTGKLIVTLSDAGSKGVNSVAFSPDGKVLVAGDGNGRTYLWNPVTGKQLAVLPNPGSRGVISVACNPDDVTMAAGDDNGSIYIWNLVTGKLIATLADPNNVEINSVAFSANGKTLATSDQDGSVFLWYARLPLSVSGMNGPRVDRHDWVHGGCIRAAGTKSAGPPGRGDEIRGPAGPRGRNPRARRPAVPPSRRPADRRGPAELAWAAPREPLETTLGARTPAVAV